MKSGPLRPYARLVGAALMAAAGGFISAELSPVPADSPHKVSPQLQEMKRAGRTGRVKVIIQYHDGASARDEQTIEAFGGSPGKHLRRIRGVAAEMPLSEIEALADDPGIRRIVPDRIVKPNMEFGAPGAGAGAARERIEFTGKGIGVAVIDSGVADHPDLPSLAGFVDFLQPNAPFTSDPFGHGTHVAGIIGGSRRPSPDGSGLVLGGMAPGTHIISLRVLDRWGEGRVSDVIEAIGWAVANRNEFNIRILNISLGHPVAEPQGLDPLVEACEDAWEAGLVVVTSAGNQGLEGNGTITSPGHSARILTIGALDDLDTLEQFDDEVAPFSSQGPTMFDLVVKPDLLAPGHSIISLRATHSSIDVSHPEARVSVESGPSGAAREPLYFQMSGSSMAAAVVSGSVALMLEADPTLTPDTIKARLMASARRVEDASIYERGAGTVDVESALGYPGHAEMAISPSLYMEEGDVLVKELAGAWGGGDAWLLDLLYGDPAGWDEDVIWENGFLDDPCASGSGLIWENGMIWQGRKLTQDSELSGEGMIWQGQKLSTDSGVSGEGMIWQGRKLTLDDTTSGAGFGWTGSSEDLACTSGAGQIWQNGMIWQGRQLSKDSSLSGEGMIWQGRK